MRGIKNNPFELEEQIESLNEELERKKELAECRRKKLDEIRETIKSHYPDVFGKGCVKPSIVEVLNYIFEGAKVVERGRDAFRDELVEKFGYSPNDLRLLMEAKLEAEK